MFAWTLRRFARMLLAGRPENRRSTASSGVDSCSTIFFGQKKVVEKTALPAKRWPAFVSALGSKYHFVIFWGFLIITVGTVETLDPGAVSRRSRWRLLIGRRRSPTLITAPSTGLRALVLALVVFAVFRRIVLQPRLIPMSRDAAAILGAIAGLMVTYFGMHASASTGAPRGLPGPTASPLAPGADARLAEARWLHVVSCWRSSTTCSTRSTATSSRPCPTSTSASWASAASCPS